MNKFSTCRNALLGMYGADGKSLYSTAIYGVGQSGETTTIGRTAVRETCVFRYHEDLLKPIQ